MCVSKCLVLIVTHDDEENKGVLKTSTYLKNKLQEIFKEAEISTQFVPKDGETIRKLLLFYSETLMIDLIIIIGGDDVHVDDPAIKDMNSIIHNMDVVSSAKLLKCLEALPLDIQCIDKIQCQLICRTQYNTIILHFPKTSEEVSNLFKPCVDSFNLLKECVNVTQTQNELESLKKTSNILSDIKSRSESKVNSRRIQTSVADEYCINDYEEALHIIFAALSDFNRKIEHRAIDNILGSILANDIVAPEEFVSTPISKVNGYAYNSKKHSKNTEYSWPIYQLMTADKNISCCIAINAGDAIPEDSDSVIEKTDAMKQENDRVIFTTAESHKKNIDQNGFRINENEIIVSKGIFIGPLEKGLLSNLEMKDFAVYSKPRVSFFSIESYLAEKFDTILNSATNRVVLDGLLRELNIDFYNLGVVKLDPNPIKAALERAFTTDDIVIIATEQLYKPEQYILTCVLMDDFHASIHFSHITTNPDAVTIFATCIFDKKTKFIFGLPGGVLNSLVAYNLIVVPSLKYFMGTGFQYQRCHMDFLSSENWLHTAVSRRIKKAIQEIDDVDWFEKLFTSGNGLHASIRNQIGLEINTEKSSRD